MTSSELINNLPQILTALAALITAVSGLVSALKNSNKNKDK
jgi:hypothetical protein